MEEEEIAIPILYNTWYTIGLMDTLLLNFKQLTRFKNLYLFIQKKKLCLLIQLCGSTSKRTMEALLHLCSLQENHFLSCHKIKNPLLYKREYSFEPSIC